MEAENSFGNTPLHNCAIFGSAAVSKVKFERTFFTLRLRLAGAPPILGSYDMGT